MPAHNANFGTDPAVTGPFDGWVPVPDTQTVPIPPAALLPDSGLVEFVGRHPRSAG